jgi:Predicted phosphoesterase
MKKIAILSDLHSNKEALEAILINISQYEVDEIICLGDVLGLGPNPKECLDLIFEYNIKLLLGTHELYYLRGIDIEQEMCEEEKEHQRWIASQLPENYKEKLKDNKLIYELKHKGTKLAFLHFFFDDSNIEKNPFYDIDLLRCPEINDEIEKIDADFIFYGHEHSGKDIFINNKKCLNVKSSGCTRSNITSYLLVEIEEDNIVNITRKNVLFDRNTFLNNIKETNYPDKDVIAEIYFGINV